MGRGVSCGGGQSSLGYLLGGGAAAEADGNAPPPPENAAADDATAEPTKDSPEPSDDNTNNAETDEQTPESFNVINQNPTAEGHDSSTNNYHRADGQNCGNFITNRPSTKVHAAPGGNSSLGYLFGDEKK